MSSLAAAALRRAVAASGARSFPSPGAFSPASSRLFSTEASGAEAGSQDDVPFLKSSDEGLAYGRLYSATPGGTRFGKNTLKTDIIQYLDKCELSPDDVKFDYNRGYYPMAAFLKFPSVQSFTTALRQINQSRMFRLENLSREQWDQKPSSDGKSVLLQGVPRNAQADDIERFLSGTNYEPPPFESFIRPGIPEPIRVVLVRFRTRTDATNAFIAKNRSFCLNNSVSVRVIQ